ncbi:MAG TPA: DUF4965 domain-containing protein [Microvirga sp.]|nr:DUF4965 domain-containing protein [Microvirga sp.]
MLSKTLRHPAVPLVTIDPHTNVWSMADRLHDDWPRHWTGSKMALFGVIRVDGVAYRFLGGREWLAHAAEQKSCEVHPTRSDYRFHCGPVELTVSFVTPLLLDDLDLLSRPLTYVRFAVRALDASAHEVSVYLDMTGEWAVNLPHEWVVWNHESQDGLEILSFRSTAQRILAEAGDHRRIEWGTAFLAARSARARAVVGDIDICRDAFIEEGRVTGQGLQKPPRKAGYNRDPVLAVALDLSVAANGTARDTVFLAYDDEFSIEYFHRPLRPWWRRTEDADPLRMIADAAAEEEAVVARARAFDERLARRAEDLAGPGYATLLALTYRQSVAAHKLVAGPDGSPLFFSKENFSNGCIATVDVTYPSAPLFLAFNPTLVRGMLDPIFAYCAGREWPYPFPAHDLGTYPKANGQTYRGYAPGGTSSILETQMPVEESGNMLILTAAVVRAEGRPSYAAENWDLLTQWADYLVEVGFNPGEQLCTDDFSGVLACNVNLSAKAILGLASYAAMAEALGDRERASRYRKAAETFADEWLAAAPDGDGTRLAFDQEGTWSLKYNLVWDRLLSLNLFPAEALRREHAFYRSKVLKYGIPLDQRRTLTKPEWMLWAASLVDDPELFRDFVERILRYADETPNRVPFADLYLASNGRQIAFQARSVVGGLFIRLLEEWTEDGFDWASMGSGHGPG